jgi:ribonuclease Z
MFHSEIKSQFNEDISILVQLDNHPCNYICECGDASNWTVKEVQNAHAVFISHTHIDHFVNFDRLIHFHFCTLIYISPSIKTHNSLKDFYVKKSSNSQIGIFSN